MKIEFIQNHESARIDCKIDGKNYLWCDMWHLPGMSRKLIDVVKFIHRDMIAHAQIVGKSPDFSEINCKKFLLRFIPVFWASDDGKSDIILHSDLKKKDDLSYIEVNIEYPPCAEDCPYRDL